MKCSFCEQPLVCKACQTPFQPPSGEAHLGVYQPDTAVHCPKCQKPLICKNCGFDYASDEEDEDD